MNHNNHNNHNHNNHNNESKICRMKLSDEDYLKHMIPHHQVAVDISYMLQKKTKSPFMHEILRKLIWVQKYEISLMKSILKKDIPKISSNHNMNTNYILTQADFIKPNFKDVSNTYCDPNFFNPEKHMEHLKHMKLNDKMYIEHMIPHHQVAVDMSKILIKNTKNDFMIKLAYRIIRSQQEEIIMLNDYLNSTYKHQSELLN